MDDIGKDSKGKSSAAASSEEEEEHSVELDGAGGFDINLLPRGFNFVPDDEELVLGYLLLKALGESLHGMEPHIKDIPYDEIYRCAPSQDILNSYGVRSYCGNKVWFFFTKKNERDDATFGKVRETADKSGYWRVESSQEPVLGSDGNICAYKRKLRFHRKVKQEKEVKDIKVQDESGSLNNFFKTSWILEEYQLAESFLSTDIPKENVYGLGKISRLIIAKSEERRRRRRRVSSCPLTQEESKNI